jgi:hypothetical protein
VPERSGSLPGPEGLHPARRAGRLLGDHPVVGVDDGEVARQLVRPDAGLGGHVALQVVVPVEVVLGQVQPHRDPRPEGVGPPQLERRHLGDHHVDIAGDGVAEG